MSFVKEIINDTLKRPDLNGNLRWSVTRLTMFSAWVVALWSYHYDIIKNGFNFNAFCVIVTVALGSKITDGISKKLNPEIKTDEKSN